jgi:hypothetical protein
VDTAALVASQRMSTVAPEVDLEGGRVLVEQLQQVGFPLDAALWYLDPAAEEWRLLLASPLVEQQGRRQAYEHVEQLLRRLQLPLLDLNRIVVLTPGEPLIQALRSASGLRGGTWLTHDRFDSILIERAYLYFLR